MKYDINKRLHEYHMIGTCINSALGKLKTNFIELNLNSGYDFNNENISIEVTSEGILINQIVSDGIHLYPAWICILKLSYNKEKYCYDTIITHGYENIQSERLATDFVENIDCIYECINHINMKKFEAVEDDRL